MSRERLTAAAAPPSTSFDHSVGAWDGIRGRRGMGSLGNLRRTSARTVVTNADAKSAQSEKPSIAGESSADTSTEMTRAQPMADCFVGVEMSFRHRSLELVHNKHAMRVIPALVTAGCLHTQGVRGSVCPH